MRRTRITKNWLLILVMALLTLQFPAGVADMMPVHSDDSEHLHLDIHHQDTDGEQLTGDIQAGDTEHPDSLDNCHNCHCHGSHLLLLNQACDLSWRAPSSVARAPSRDNHPPPIATILRPPIA